MTGLTPKQAKILAFVRQRIEQGGYPPTIREVGREFGIASPNGVLCHLRALEKKGCIDRGSSASPSRGAARRITVPGVSAGGFSLPFLGVVAAGTAIEAAEQSDVLDLRALFGDDGAFTLRVADDTLLDERIAAGDALVLRPVRRGDAGRTVAAEVCGAFGLFDYLPRSRRIVLAPRRGEEAVQADHDDPAVRVLGVVVGVLRWSR